MHLEYKYVLGVNRLIEIACVPLFNVFHLQFSDVKLGIGIDGESGRSLELIVRMAAIIDSNCKGNWAFSSYFISEFAQNHNLCH